ncbi:hypothetical protein DFH11DRAFT_1603111 [Phellopilus nigrolimitatus]|nr:hypothetical protein DFH11DRAFT_1603111 [Phellopilus nigrolimitatus]
MNVQLALRHVTESGTNVAQILHEPRTNKKPPTFVRTNNRRATEGSEARCAQVIVLVKSLMLLYHDSSTGTRSQDASPLQLPHDVQPLFGAR